MKHSPGLTGPIPWDEAPTGTTHAFRGLIPMPQHHIARPVTECPYPACPDDATHTKNGTDRPYKAGPNRHARVWSTYNGEPAWVCASATLNEDLDDPTKFAPIIREPL